MTTAMIQQPKNNGSYLLSPEDIQTLVASNIIPKGTPEGTIRMFGKFCAESGLSPFRRQVHLISRFDSKSNEYKYNIQTGIDGYRATADRTGLYAGNDDYVFDGDKSEWQMIEAKKMRPTVATSTVYKLVGGIRAPFTATARWEEYFPGEKMGFMWNKMPFLMLGKCAEALALRKAFPNELSGIYTDEEMAQAQPAAVHVEEVAETPAEVKKIADEQFGPRKLKHEDEIMPIGAKSNGKRFRDLSEFQLKQALKACERDDVKNLYPELATKIREFMNDSGLPF